MAKVHRMYRRSWWRRSRDITERDQQAMYNFYLEGRAPWDRSSFEIEESLVQRFCSKEVLAEHFCCSTADVSVALTQPWIQTRKANSARGRFGTTWWESDHSDPLELVKLFYPAHVETFFSRAAVLERQAQEKWSAATIDAAAYLERRFGAGYVSPGNIAIVQRVLDEITEQLEAAGVEYTARLVADLLDERII